MELFGYYAVIKYRVSHNDFIFTYYIMQSCGYVVNSDSLSKSQYLLGASEITANLYCNCVHL